MSSLPNYDNWLVAPMERAEAESERFFDWCEEHNIEPNDPVAERRYEDWLTEWEEPDFDDEPDYDADLREDYYDDFGETK